MYFQKRKQVLIDIPGILAAMSAGAFCLGIFVLILFLFLRAI